MGARRAQGLESLVPPLGKGQEVGRLRESLGQGQGWVSTLAGSRASVQASEVIRGLAVPWSLDQQQKR